MATLHDDISDLLLWRISGELQDGEEQALQDWARGSEKRARLLQATLDDAWLRDQWERAARIDVAASWERFQTKIPKTTRLKRRRPTVFTILMCGLVLFLALILVLRSNQSSKVVSPTIATVPNLSISGAKSINLDASMAGKIVRVGPFMLSFQGQQIILDYQTGQLPSQADSNRVALLSPSGQKSRLRLPDGTTVLLNARAQLDLPMNYGAAGRELGLKGEASFNVIHNGQPFTVDVPLPAAMTTLYPKGENLTITAQGTDFDVRANPQDGSIRTLLFSGKITVRTPGGKPRDVKPGEAYVLDRTGKENVVRLDKLKGATSWRDGEFVFEDEPVDNILQELARWYNVQIIYRNNLTDSFLVSGPRDKPITYLLEQMKATHHFKYSIQGDTVFVSH